VKAVLLVLALMALLNQKTTIAVGKPRMVTT
jgi:hypothetical protein